MTNGKREASNHIFPRDFSMDTVFAERGQGAYLYDDKGKRYLDASGGAAVTTIGHGVEEIVESIRASAELPYVHSTRFQSRAALELADFLAQCFPGPSQDVLVHFTSGGSEATETALKLARQYWNSRGEPGRYKILSRQTSYHGTTIGALSVSGLERRRAPYKPLLWPSWHIAPCYCYRCPFDRVFPDCELACAEELEARILQEGPETVAAFICEPVVGAASGAVPPDGYLQKVREICDRYDVLWIADEVMTGAGRTGRYFAVEHWNVVPDLIGMAKGLAGGYAPVGAVLVSEQVGKVIRDGVGRIEHGFTYQGNPRSMAIALAVQQYVEKHGLVARADRMGKRLEAGLESLRDLPVVGDVRGLGLLWTIEFVADQQTSEEIPAEKGFLKRLDSWLKDAGVLVYPVQRSAHERAGDRILIAPPFIITDDELQELVTALREGISAIAEECGLDGA